MTRKAQRLLDKARQTKAGWMPRELLSLYSKYGFEIREGKGSEKVVSHPDYKHLRATVANHPRELAPPYVLTAVRLIDELIKIQKEIDNDE